VNGKASTKVTVKIDDNGEYASIIDLDESNFDQMMSGSPVPILVDFFASWCRPCRTIVPVLDEIAKEQAGHLKIARVDVDNSPRFIVRFRILNIPTLVFFQDGEVKDQVVGLTTKAELISRLKTLS
jgi:thioredoxin 1